MEKKYIKRLLEVPNRSFFLFGPRGVGKSTWLEKTMQDALFFNLLDSSLYLELSQNPANLEALAGNIPEGSWIVIDEIQKIPTLLDEVHRLMEKKSGGLRYAVHRPGSCAAVGSTCWVVGPLPATSTLFPVLSLVKLLTLILHYNGDYCPGCNWKKKTRPISWIPM
jgi:hypothetical protein